MPHAIVHINAGWGDANYNVPSLQPILDSAVANYIGIAEIGDDASWMATNVFGFTLVDNMPAPIGDGTQYTAASDSLLVGLHPAKDHTTDSTKYPYLNGIIINTSRKILHDSVLYFKPYNTSGNAATSRCQADADKYTIVAGQEGKLTMLGFEDCSHNGARVVPPNPELDVVVAFQDTVKKTGINAVIRRAVALSYEPQFLKNGVASQQLIYDAVMYASLAFQNRQPAGIAMTVVPNVATIPAGDSIMFTGQVLDANIPPQPIPGYVQSLKWSLWTLPGPAINTTASFLRAGSGALNTFKARTAYTTYIIRVNLDTLDQSGNIFHLSWADTVYVRPGPPTHLNIEASHDSLTSLWKDARLIATTFTSGMLNDTVYAVLRDAFQNWYSLATSTAWSSQFTAVASVAIGRPLYGNAEGVITRQTANTATDWVYSTQNGMTDSLQVNLNNVSYSKIIITTPNNSSNGITGLQMRTDQDTTLYAWGLEANGSGIWDKLQVQWNTIGAIKFNSSPPNAQFWTFQPETASTGKIFISYGSLRDTISVTFLPGLPNYMALYPKIGAPDSVNNAPYGPSITVTAGQVLPLDAKIFSISNEWLSAYEGSGAAITWTLFELTRATNSGTLSAATGSFTQFTGTKAYQAVRVTATFTGGISASITILIQPGPVSKLVIEPDTTGRSAYPNAAHRAGSVTIGGTATAISVYAVLRDQYNNFVAFSNPTIWLSRDSTQVTVTNGIPAYGEGVCHRVPNLGQAWVLAQDGNYPGITDSVLVVLSNISYDSLRIVVGPGNTVIKNLSMTIDQDTLLKVQGLRSDGAGWDDIPAAWTITNTLTTVPGAPGSSITWRFMPTDTGTGYIKVTSGTAVPDSITVQFSHGIARSIVLYSAYGNPGTLQAYPAPSATIIDSAGSALPVVAYIFDKAGNWLNSYATAATSAITWDTIEFAANKLKPTGSLTPKSGYGTAFTPTVAFNTVYVIGTFSESGNTYKDTIRVQVVPGPANHLVIEATPDSSVSPNKDNKLSSMTFSSTTLKDTAYAVLRDAYGNFVSQALLAQWASRNTGVVSVLADKGEITRQTLNAATTFVVAVQGSMKDSLQVSLDKVGYSRINIVVNGNVSIDTLRMRTDQDTTLSALALLNDGSNRWVPVTVTWAPDAGMTFNPNPRDSSAWTFQPLTPDTGFIKIVLGALRDSIVVVFSYGNPQTMKLYPKTGQPDVTGNMPYPDSITVVAGVALPLWAKLFSQSSQWLKGYERSDAPITWKIDELTGATNSGTLDKYAGSQTTFTGYKAYQRVRVTATFSENGITLTKSIVVSITHAAAAQLDIEPDTTGLSAFPNVPHRAGQVTMQSTDTTLSVFAVLRDQFGNFVSFSNPTTWLSKDTTKAGVRGGAAGIGEGIAIRKTDQGQAVIVATDGKNTSFSDSVIVVLSNISYTKLRIVTGDSTKITSLTLTLDQSQELKVQGLRSDGAGWEYVQAKWAISGTITTTTNPPGSSINWIVTPADTGSGRIKVTLGTATPDSITVHFTAGSPMSIMLYPADGSPNTQQPYPDPAIAVMDSAGKALPVVAKVFDRAHNWLSSYETSISPVAWSIVELAGNTDMPTGTITPGSGYKTTLTATRADNSVLVIAQFTQGAITLLDTVKVTVTPGSPNHLVIELSDKKDQSPHKDNPVDTVQITSTQTYALVYAIIRDAYGNYIKVSTNTAWLSLDSAVVSATNGVTGGQGQITRTPSAPRDRAQVTAASLDYVGLKDTTTAKVLQYYYLALQIVNPRGDSITSLNMNTNQDTTLYVMGLRSDNGKWEYTSAQWQSLGGLSIVPSAPGNASAWTFSPDKPGTGTIRVTSLNGDTVTTRPDHIAVTFTVGPPTIVQIQILTPPDSLIAGDTIVSLVRILNKDGLVPDTFCTSAAYNNALGGVSGHDPLVIIDTTGKMGQSMHECFINGVDTVKYVLYRAPSGTDTLDKITVALNGLSATTDPFLMHPGDLARIAIEDFSGKNIDSVKLSYPTGSQLFLAVGYDAYGNRRGPELSNWTTDGTLHAVTDASNVSRVFYQASQSRYDEAGSIIATATGKNGALIIDSSYVKITGPQTAILSAITQDSSGNGYLDHIVIRFDKLVTITKEFPADSIVIIATGDDGKKYTLVVDSIRGRSSSTDSVFIIYLAEPKSGDASYGKPETDWKPLITLPAITGVSPVNAYPATDKAGPVIWSVVKTISGGDPANRAADLVTITFSEPISTNGNNFNTSLAPVIVLHVWLKGTTPDGRDTMIARDTILKGINEFFNLENNNTTLSFYMSNSNDLTSRDYISIVVDTTGRDLADRSTPANIPVFDNQKIEVVVRSQPPKQLIVAPNPSGPNFTHISSPYNNGPGQMHLEFNPYARDWVRTDRSGVVLTFDVSPRIDPSTGKLERVTGLLKIYDMIGNTVFSLDSTGSRDGIFPSKWAGTDTSTFHFDMYWNGSNSRGMRVAPGIYRTMLYLKYEHDARPVKYLGTVGISK